MPTKLTLGFSPCPNDTFIFDALVNGKIDTGGLEFEPVLVDVESLNQWSLEGKLDISKLSFPAFFQSTDKYVLLNSGSALGKAVGPLLVSKKNIANQASEISNSLIAIPGNHTTANLLLRFAFPQANKKIPMLFSDIEEAVISGRADLGLIIHENRFTYQEKGLHKVIDLGEYWEEKMKLPIPLGGIAIKRKLDPATGLRIQDLIRQSLEYAWAHYPLLSDYVIENSQALREVVIRQHIELYVNDFTQNLGEEGKGAIEKLFQVYGAIGDEADNSLSSSELFLS